MNMEYYIKFLFNFIAKKFHTIYFPFGLIILFVIVNYSFLNNVLFFAVLYSLFIIFWIFKMIYVPKNKKQKHGIIIYIDKEVYFNRNENNFVRKLKYNLSNSFNIIVVIKNPFINLKTPERKDKFLKQKKCSMLIDSFAFEGKEDSDNIYSIETNYITILTPFINETIIENLKRDFTNGFCRIIKLSNNNSINDVKLNADLMAASLKYFASIIYILFGQIDIAENQLKNIVLEPYLLNNKVAKYLKNSITSRCLDINIYRIEKLVEGNLYLTSESHLLELKKLLIYFSNFSSYYGNNKHLKYRILSLNAIVSYLDNKPYEAKGSLKKMNSIFPGMYIHKISEAFIDSYEENYNEAIKKYKQIFSIPNIDKTIIDNSYDFVKKEYSKKQSRFLLFCMAAFELLYYDDINGEKNKSDFLKTLDDSQMIKRLDYHLSKKEG